MSSLKKNQRKNLVEVEKISLASYVKAILPTTKDEWLFVRELLNFKQPVNTKTTPKY